MIIATAGHIDHGKTALVHAITGIDTDRLPEEKKRGMSIDIGFAYHTLPGGQVLGFVDVPGHERFIRNMLAGVTGIDYAMLIIAADDGPMPQTLEHLAILDLLGVRDGVVVLTKIDRVEPARIDDVKTAIRNVIEGTCLGDADILPVSAIKGDGIGDLRDHLEAATDLIGEREVRGNFRLAIDRSFTIQGAGLVVTGAVFSGSVSVGDHLILSPKGTPVRVRGIHAQNKESQSGVAGQRCALNIAGSNLKKADVHRGDWLVAEIVHDPISRFDARLRVLPSENKPLRHWTPVHVHLGAAEFLGRVAILGEKSIPPGDSELVQIVFGERIGALRSDGFILRDQSAQRTIAGGRIIDTHPPARGRAKPERLQFIRAMEEETAADALFTLLEQNPAGLQLKPFQTTWNLTQEDRAELYEMVEMERAGPDNAPLGFSARHWQAICEETVAGLRGWHEKNPDRAGPSLIAMRQQMTTRIPAPVFEGVVAALVADKQVINLGSSFCLPGFEATMSAKDTALWNKIKPILVAGHTKAPVVSAIAGDLDSEPRAIDKFLVRCAKLDMVYQVAKNRFLLPDAVLELADLAEVLASEKKDGFSAADFRDRSNVGRNLAIELLEYFDRAGLTWRSGDTRKLRNPVADVFGDGAN